MTASLKSLSIIIPSYNGEKLLEEFLPSVLAAASNCPGRVEIILVDDCSTDESVAVASKFAGKYPFLKILKTPFNGGFSKACNFGAKQAGFEILFFLNNDVRLEPGYFAVFSDYFVQNDVFALSPCGYDYSTGNQLDGIKAGFWKNGFMRFTRNIYNRQLKDSPDNRPYLSFGMQGAYFFVDRKKFEFLDGFDEIYSPYIMEETDLAYRALKKGWKILYGPEFRAYHKGGSSIKSRTSVKVKIISARNRLIFTWKNIHSRRLLAGHFVFLFLQLLTLNYIEWNALIKALKLLPEIILKRKQEKNNSQRSDMELLDFYSGYFTNITRFVGGI